MVVLVVGPGKWRTMYEYYGAYDCAKALHNTNPRHTLHCVRRCRPSFKFCSAFNFAFFVCVSLTSICAGAVLLLAHGMVWRFICTYCSFAVAFVGHTVWLTHSSTWYLNSLPDSQSDFLQVRQFCFAACLLWLIVVACWLPIVVVVIVINIKKTARTSTIIWQQHGLVAVFLNSTKLHITFFGDQWRCYSCQS